MNIHNKLICHRWRGNFDMQIILDKSARINYMVKYATKGEKDGISLCQLFRDIVDSANDEENPQTKIRSLMLRYRAG